MTYFDGFFSKTNDGIELAVYDLKHKDKLIRLFPTIHIGLKSFYDNINDMFSDLDCILYERLDLNISSDSLEISYKIKNNVLSLGLSQIILAKCFNLSLQIMSIDYNNLKFFHSDMPIEKIDGEHSDKIDMATYRLLSNSYPVLFSDYMKDPEKQKQNYKNFYDSLDDETISSDMAFSESREKILIDTIDAKLQKNDSLGVIYGYMHMPRILNQLYSRGFFPDQKREFLAVPSGI